MHATFSWDYGQEPIQCKSFLLPLISPKARNDNDTDYLKRRGWKTGRVKDSSWIKRKRGSKIQPILSKNTFLAPFTFQRGS
jgi:hypothetical protein